MTITDWAKYRTILFWKPGPVKTVSQFVFALLKSFDIFLFRSKCSFLRLIVFFSKSILTNINGRVFLFVLDRLTALVQGLSHTIHHDRRCAMKRWVVLAALLCCSAATGEARDCAGIAVPDTLAVNTMTLTLNGAGVRTKFFMDMYVGALYLTAPQNDPVKILAADEPMAIRLQILSGLISSEKMEAATREGFHNATSGNTAALQNLIEQFIAVFREKIEKGDVYEMVYVPREGTRIYKNTALKTTIPGMPFKKALFGIWLCDKPAQESLKQQMLGGA